WCVWRQPVYQHPVCQLPLSQDPAKNHKNGHGNPGSNVPVNHARNQLEKSNGQTKMEPQTGAKPKGNRREIKLVKSIKSIMTER
ncbi:hypothetical protein ACV1C5_11730, partial [Aeromonas caviae]